MTGSSLTMDMRVGKYRYDQRSWRGPKRGTSNNQLVCCEVSKREHCGRRHVSHLGITHVKCALDPVVLVFFLI